MQKSKDPPTFMVLFEDSAALAGLLIAFLGTLAASWLQMPALDGIAAIAIGLVLGVTALVLARENKELLIGEPADRRINESILKLASAAEGIESANGLFTTHLGPDDIVASLSLEFCDDMKAPDIEKAVVELERRIKAAHPAVTALFIKPQTTSTYRKQREAVGAM
jgi:divalent metal cation (Fe/Co/Zn/Cd) transporter